MLYIPDEQWRSKPCKEWQGNISAGYGVKYMGVVDKHPIVRKVHRLVWEDAYGPIPDGLCICHHCDNRKCYELSHLFLGTRGDNNRDRHAKGRTIAANSSKTHCKYGHEFTPENTYLHTDREGIRRRYCRTCNRTSHTPEHI